MIDVAIFDLVFQMMAAILEDTKFVDKWTAFIDTLNEGKKPGPKLLPKGRYNNPCECTGITFTTVW